MLRQKVPEDVLVQLPIGGCVSICLDPGHVTLLTQHPFVLKHPCNTRPSKARDPHHLDNRMLRAMYSGNVGKWPSGWLPAEIFGLTDSRSFAYTNLSYTVATFGVVKSTCLIRFSQYSGIVSISCSTTLGVVKLG